MGMRHYLPPGATPDRNENEFKSQFREFFSNTIKLWVVQIKWMATWPNTELGFEARNGDGQFLRG